MQGGIFTYGLLGGLAIALLVAAFTDMRRRQIDNWLNAGIALAAPLFWWATGLSLWPGVAAQFGLATACFVICAGLFALRQMGGGDVKLLTALALWIQPAWFLKLIVLMALIGGLLTIVLGAWHIARRQRDKLAIPYGLAIATAGLWVIASQYLPAFHAATAAG
ncbi:MAG: prepilin peptidase [Sphingomonadales bacterium]|nr:prepilin peptidase [Sphingomonadales bacterium]